MRIPGRLVTVLMLLPMLGGWGLARGQETAAPTGVIQTAPTTEKPDPTKRRLSDREKVQQQKDLKQELRGDYKKWLDEDVRWIITPSEEEAFKHLSNDEEIGRAHV